MAIEVFIRRKIKQGCSARKIMPLILQLRALATSQTGYISGRTLGEIGNLGELLVISTWNSIEDWHNWLQSKERRDIDQKIEELSGESAEYKMYEPISIH